MKKIITAGYEGIQKIMGKQSMKNGVIAMIMCIGITFGCKMPDSLTQNSSNSPGNGNTYGDSSQNNNGQDREVANTDPRDDLLSAARKFRDLPYFTATMLGDGSQQVNGKLEYAAPDRYRIIYTGGAASGTEFIIAGKQTYMKTGGKWRRFPVDIGTMLPSVRELLEESEIRKIRAVQRLGDDSVDGVQAILYSYEGSTPSKSIDYKSRLWLAKSTGLPLKVVIEYNSGELKTMTISYDTETPVTIEPPIQ